MIERTVQVGSPGGLHARPAALFVAAAAAAPVEVTIRTADKPAVPARSMLAVLALGARRGTEVTIAADGPEAEAVVDDLAALVAGDLEAETTDA
ncbi:phosphocarrier protein [Stackebrandtia albiflava]|uniref:Phosphocarrier protein HPr n=1 Tax=Stackebrandtia albiflava TaxID=406432 RepID=A0A562VCP2_9ACTN|nr:HPr family phosphocarrier protein [Stackebrandtia albiflava]TWJ15632.1 phosphocarrier protein [Stackebrandtia albiflava]